MMLFTLIASCAIVGGSAYLWQTSVGTGDPKYSRWGILLFFGGGLLLSTLISL